MTGKELIKAIEENDLLNTEILSQSKLYFETSVITQFNEPFDYAYLWTHDDRYQDVIFNHEGDLTHGFWDPAKALKY